MFFIFPTATDAPSYHVPFATIGLVVACTVIFIFELMFPDVAEFFILRYRVFNPVAWFSSCLMHSGIMHLVGNMILLGICGWIVEGKVGWWRFLIIFFAIGVPACIFEQLVMFAFSDGGSLGASGVIYGLLAIAMIWAPENEITLMYFGLLLFYPIYGTFSVGIMGFCFAMIAIEFLTVWFTFFAMSSALLHLMGFVPGAVIGFAMLKLRLVDCEGYDLISIRSGNAGKRVKTIAQERQEKENRKQAIEDARKAKAEGLQRVEEYINNGHYEMAYRRFSMIKRKSKKLVLPEDQYVAIINGMWGNETSRPRAIPIMESYLQHYDKLKVPIVLKLARYALVDESRPRKAIQVLNELNEADLNEKQKQVVRSIVGNAKQKLADGSLDFSDE